MELRSRRDTIRRDQDNASRDNLLLTRGSYLPWLRRRIELRLGTAWVLFTILGSLIIFFSPVEWRAVLQLGTVLLLCVYLTYGIRIEQKNTLRFADSLYFMGFLWTLVALINVFVFRRGLELDTGSILMAYGYALVTTCAGMFFRLVVIQFQETLPDRLVDAQEEIDRRIAALADQIKRATDEMHAFRENAARALNDQVASLGVGLQRMETEIMSAHRSLCETSTGWIEDSVKNLTRRLDGIAVPHDVIKDEVTKLAQQLGRYAEKLGKIIPKLDETIEGVADELCKFAKSISERDDVKRLEAGFRNLAEALTVGKDRLDSAMKVWEQTRGPLENTRTVLEALGQTINRIHQSLSEAEAQLRQFLTISSLELQERFIDVQAALEQNKRTSEAIEAAMEEVVQFMRQRLLEEREPPHAK